MANRGISKCRQVGPSSRQNGSECAKAEGGKIPLEQVTSQSEQRWRGIIFPWVATCYLVLMLGLPSVATFLVCGTGGKARLLWIALAPWEWSILFVLIAGTLSIPHQWSIIPGKFSRDLNSSLYFNRRLYGLCWTTVYYNKLAYHLVLSVPLLKRWTFRIFGYRGSMSFSIYPDTWIRDLPLLEFEEGVYLANRATIGSNIVLKDGSIYVDRVILRRGATLGHLAVIGAGDEIGVSSEIGVRTTLGVRTRVGDFSTVSAAAGLEHGVKIGNKVYISAAAAVGNYARLADGSRIEFGEVVAPRTRIRADRDGSQEP